MRTRALLRVLVVLLALAAGYVVRMIHADLMARIPYPPVPTDRLDQLVAVDCPKIEPNTRRMLDAIAQVVAAWPASLEVVNGVEVPAVLAPTPTWCKLAFARNSDLYLDARAIVRESQPLRLHLDVYAAIDDALVASDRPTFSLTAVVVGRNTYVFDSRLYKLMLVEEGKPPREVSGE